MQEIIAKNYTTIPLGQQGENLARCVCFEIGDWRTSYGEGRAELLVMRAGDTAPYPATIAQSGNTVRWELTAADTAKDGLGAVELRYYVGEVLVKSHTKLTQVYPAMGEAITLPPDPWQSWVTQVLAAAQATQNAVAYPPTIGANGNWYLWDGEQMVDSGVSAHGIAGAKGDKGDTGATGAKGDAGTNGRDGADGRDGLTTSVTVNGITHTQVDGNIDLGTVITEHQPLIAYRTASEQDVIDASKLTEPALVSVGQYLRVAGMDDDGHAVLECVPAPSGGDMKLKIAGTAQTPDADGYVNVPVIGTNRFGVAKFTDAFSYSNGIAYPKTDGTSSNIATRSRSYTSVRFIVSNNYDYAVKCAMTDGREGTAWTDAERLSALLRMGCKVDENGFVKWTAQS